MESKFSSPREEALEIAYQSRKDILENKRDAVSLLRACLVIAKNLNKTTDEEWINCELFGYGSDLEVPSYRLVSCKYENNGPVRHTKTNCKMRLEAYILDSFLRKNEGIRYVDPDYKFGSAIVPLIEVERALYNIVNRCFSFLNGAVTELQYG